MIDINYIKWKVGYASGFKYCSTIVGANERCVIRFEDFKTVTIGSKEWNKIYNFILLQRAIEGCLLHLGYHQIVNGEGFWLIKGTDQNWFEVGEFSYQAIEQALHYMYDQEKQC